MTERDKQFKKLKKPNLYVSMHSCHELRAGNGDRLLKVAKKAAPYLKFVSIAGSNVAVKKGSSNWSDAIQPLDKGDYDISKFIVALNKVGYKGEVFLHTFALEDAPQNHLKRSMEMWNKLNAKLKVSK